MNYRNALWEVHLAVSVRSSDNGRSSTFVTETVTKVTKVLFVRTLFISTRPYFSWFRKLYAHFYIPRYFVGLFIATYCQRNPQSKTTIPTKFTYFNSWWRCDVRAYMFSVNIANKAGEEQTCIKACMLSAIRL